MLKLKDKLQDDCRCTVCTVRLCCKVCYSFRLQLFDFFFDWERNDEKQEISNNVLHLFGKQFLLLALSVFSSSTSLLI